MGHVKEKWDKRKGELGLARRNGTPTLLFIALPKQFISEGPFVPKRGRILLITLSHIQEFPKSAFHAHGINTLFGYQIGIIGYQYTIFPPFESN